MLIGLGGEVLSSGKDIVAQEDRSFNVIEGPPNNFKLVIGTTFELIPVCTKREFLGVLLELGGAVNSITRDIHSKRGV